MQDMIVIAIGVVLVILFIGISAFFSSSEMAFISINRAMVSEKAKQGDKKAVVLENLLENPDNVISAIVIGNNFVNILASIIAGWLAIQILGNVGVGLATVVMVFLVIIFSEMAPKSLGIKNEKFAYRVARPLAFVVKVLYPFVVLLTLISNGILRLSGSKRERRTSVTEDEIMAMMRLGEEEGTIEKDEREMVNEVFEFDETRAYEIYTSKDKVEFVHEKDSVESLIKKSIDTGFSRFPVYRKNLDDVVGMVHVKDTLILEDKSVPIKQIMRKILIVNSSMKADDLLRMMKRSKTHLALLKDAKGKTRGLISMEDLIEEIFGEIVDEHDEEPGHTAT